MYRHLPTVKNSVIRLHKGEKSENFSEETPSLSLSLLFLSLFPPPSFPLRLLVVKTDIFKTDWQDKPILQIVIFPVLIKADLKRKKNRETEIHNQTFRFFFLDVYVNDKSVK